MNVRRTQGFRFPALLLTLLLLSALALPAGAQMPLSLFNGVSMTGWTQHGPWTATGGVLATNGGGARSVFTAVPFADASLVFEYNESAPIGAKLRLFAAREGNGGIVVDLDNTGSAAGVGGMEGLGRSHVPSNAPGWHTVRVDSTHGTLSVTLDGGPVANASGLGTRAGYLGFEASGTGQLQIRNVRLTPENPGSTFNNTDLGGWKSVAHQPGSKGGVGHTMEKTLSLGLAGGSTKPHSAKWTVKGGAAHGEDGPGGLESSQPGEDVLVQLSASVKGDAKGDNFTALGLRVTPGQLSGGYAVGVGPFAGAIEGLTKESFSKNAAPVDETVVIAHRSIEVWISGIIKTVYTDPRPESASAQQGARTAAGAISLLLPNKDVQLDVQRLAITPLPKTYGASAKSMAVEPKPVTAAAPTASVPAAPAAPSATETVLMQQQQNAAKQQEEDRQTKQRSSALMAQALVSTDPAQQMQLYTQVVQMDPSNAAAVQGVRDAQAKLQATQTAEQQAAQAQVAQQRDSQTREQQSQDALVKAQSAFLSGHMGEASSALSIAERLTPGNPLVRDLRTRINATNMLHTRLLMLGSLTGIVALIALAAMWLRRRKQQRFPVLEVTQGLDSGKRYPLDKDTVRIGAIPQDGGQKNDIVVRDVEHAISRFHCEVAKKNGQLYVTDLRSSNGTRIDGQPIEPGRPMPLRSGGRVLLAGTVELRLGYDRRPATKA